MNATSDNGTATFNNSGQAADSFDLDEYRQELADAARLHIAARLPITVAEGKNPGWAMGEDWQHQRLDAERAHQLIANVSHPTIGVRLGPDGGAIDHDIDGPGELRAFMELFDEVPPPMPTYDSGREGGEHRWAAFDDRLTATGAATITYTTRDGKNKITVRIGAGGKGAHSVMPPSRHAEQRDKSKNAPWQWTDHYYAWRAGCDLEALGLPKLPDVVVERLLAAHAGKSAKTSSNGTTKRPANSGGVHAKALAAMRTATKNMADGANGSRRLFACCCRGVEHNATDVEIVACIRVIEAERPFPRAWFDVEIIARIRDAEGTVERGAEVVIANFTEIEVEVDNALLSDGSDADPNAEKATETITVPKSMREIITEIKENSGDWPRRVDAMLFVDDADHGLDYFDRRGTAGLFGWLRSKWAVKWSKGGSYVAQAELFAEVERTATRYDAIEVLPHEPTIPGIYYRGTAPPLGDGKHLRKLLDRFRPETTVDSDLIQAALMTLFWGGAPGRRPAFVITSDDGRGTGKTTIAQIAGHLVGGLLDVSAGEDIQTLKTRLLSPDARTKRAALLDNVKTLRLSWAELESLITSSVISGRQLFVGEGQRPNLLTWFITLNGVSMATDMAQRSVIIKVVKGKNDGPWYEQTIKFINDHRQEIIGDILGALRGERYELANYSRWATWEKDVLCRLPEPDEAQKVILERQGEANCEQDEAEIIEQHFAEQLSFYGYFPETAQVRIPVATAAYWFSKAVGEPTRTAAASKRIHQMASEGQMKRLSPDKSRTHGRGFVWTGPAADRFTANIDNTLPTRIADYLNRQNRDA